MPKRIDFRKERRIQGRLLTLGTEKLEALAQALAREQNIDLTARLHELSTQRALEQKLLANRLRESVVPLFIGNDRGYPERIGSCVLARLDAEFFAFTAAHVIRASSGAPLFAPSEGCGGKLLPLPPCTAHLSPSDCAEDLDVAVLPLAPDRLGCFQRRVFLSGEIDQRDQPDEHDRSAFYFVMGYSASRTQVRVNRTQRRIHQRSFHCRTNPICAAEYVQERLSQADHIALDFDHEEIVIGKTPVTPPKLQGVSGGGIFHICRETMLGPLVAIATQNRRGLGIIVGTRIKHFLQMVREPKVL